MCAKEVLVQNQVGLHARPATFFIQKANEFKSSIWVEKEERRVNAKSLLGVLSLGIVGGVYTGQIEWKHRSRGAFFIAPAEVKLWTPLKKRRNCAAKP